MTDATTSAALRDRLVALFRRDLIGPGPEDSDLARERLDESPSRWYLTGFIAPAEDPAGLDAPPRPEGDDPDLFEESETETGEDDLEADGAPSAAADDEPSEAPNTRRRFRPSSIGITVLLPPSATEIEARVSWGDYETDPPLGPELFDAEGSAEIGPNGERKPRERPAVEWARKPAERLMKIAVRDRRVSDVAVPESAAPQMPGRGGLVLETHGRLFTYETPGGGREQVRALTVFLVNRRAPAHRNFADVSYAFQARLELGCTEGFCARRDLSGLRAEEDDLRVADLHYRDVCEYAVGRNISAGWDAEEERRGLVTRVWTEPLPRAEVERVAPNEDAALKEEVRFGMNALAQAAETPETLRAALGGLADFYGEWIAGERRKSEGLTARRRETAGRLIEEMETARTRIVDGLALLEREPLARNAFRLMNLAMSMAARRRRPDVEPEWRPFQLAFVLLNLSGLGDREHPDREIADLLFFPTGGGKTEAYLGLAAFAIALRRLRGPGLLGAGVSVIMRYTLRLLTLDQLGRAAGMICALELMRNAPEHRDEKGRRLLGDWPIEIGLWVGSAASPNLLGGKGVKGENTAVRRVEAFNRGRGKAPIPLKACPWCGREFKPGSFTFTPNKIAPRNLEIRCEEDCDFVRERPLPIVTVDEPIYRRLPAFLIATVDKFASLPWEGRTGAFFGHVDRVDESDGFFGASEPGKGRRLDNGWSLDPPDLIIQDELHLIAGPLGTVAGLYEAAIDQLAARHRGGRRIRPKIVASTATVRRAGDQIRALFDRERTAVFPPPGVDRTDSFFARTVPATQDPARLYLGVAAQGRGPKLVFLRALTTLLAGAQALYDAAAEKGAAPGRNPADPYMTALCYFNALRELGGARRIVEDEVADRAGRYGVQRRRVDPSDAPFADRRIREPMELTSRVSTDDVAKAKLRLDAAFGADADTVDVALATNMISVGLDITRLGLMLVQGQPKTAAEYIQATSRVGRDHHRPGLVLAVLNLHKPRDRMHFEQFGQFHRTFYRAVEATSVTPWAARALDRALAAVVVAAARHVDPFLAPEEAVVRLKERPETRKAVCEALVSRAPEEAVPGGREVLRQRIASLLDDWIATVDLQTQGGSRFQYREAKSPHRLLHGPLEPEARQLSAEHRRFAAGRSMRDVEPSVTLKVVSPTGHDLSEDAQ